MFPRRHLLRSFPLAAAALALRPRLFADSSAPVATTTSGRVSGLYDSGINTFHGIPYGADTATTRFQPPKPAAPWPGIRPCITTPTRAPQLTPDRPSRATDNIEPGTQSEDCLYLNVFTPALRDHGKRPVLVYFHGGAYNNGSVNSPLYDGTRLCQRGNVVVVTVNHRLNAFGYLYLGNLGLPEFASSGNVGMLDLVLALQWVRNNIAEFGGDPSRVLIFGQSGGGAKCATLMAMPAASGLFHRVMTMSGQQVKGQSVDIASARTKIIFDKLGITTANLSTLKTLPMETIQAAARSVSSDWLPVVDHVVLPRDPFTPDAPSLSAHVPMILGNVHDETAVPDRDPAGHPLTWATAPAALQNAVAQYLGPVTAESAVAKFRSIHPDYSPIDVVIAAATAFRAWPGQVLEAEHRASDPVSQPHTWVYQMDWHRTGGRAMHTIDIPFMFDNLAAAPAQVGTDLAAAQPLATAMSQMLVYYAATGNPNNSGIPHWPAYSLQHRDTMLWNTPPRIAQDPRGDERRFAAASPYRQPGTY